MGHFLLSEATAPSLYSAILLRAKKRARYRDAQPSHRSIESYWRPCYDLKPNWRNMSKIMYEIWFLLNHASQSCRVPNDPPPRRRRRKHSAIARIPLAVS